MKSIKEKLHVFLSDKKNIKIVVVSLIVVVTAIGIILGVKFTPRNNSGNTSSAISSGNSTDATSAEDSLAALAALANAGGEGQPGLDNTFSGGTIGGVSGQGGVLYDASGNPVNMYDGSSTGASSSSRSGGDSTGAGGDSEPQGGSDSVVCTIAIDCSQVSGNGVLTAAGFPELEPYAANPSILSTRSIIVNDANGDGRVGVDEAIKQACNTYGIQYEFKGASYLRGMNYLYEFNAGPNSGWMYQVNGRAPNKGCNSYYLKGGEDVLWYYVISY